jgi:glucokinase
MILAGDIGGTNARLAYFQSQNGHFQLVAERVFPSREHSELGEIVAQFVNDSGMRPDAACFGIAGPVRNGRVETSNLPWVIEQSRLAKQIHLPSTFLINDLEASAWGIGALSSADLVSLNAVSGPAVGNQAVIAPGTGLGEAGLFWDGTRHHVFACEGGHCDFAPQSEQEIELLRYLKARFGHVSYERILSGPECVRVPARLRIRKGISRVCSQLPQRRWPGDDFESGAGRQRWNGAKGAGNLDIGLRRRGIQPGTESNGNRRTVLGGRDFSESSCRTYRAVVHAIVSFQRTAACAHGGDSSAGRYQRESRAAGSGALRGGSSFPRLRKFD